MPKSLPYLDQTEDMVAWLDRQGRVLYGNAAICSALGYSQDEMSTLHVWDICPSSPQDWAERWKSIAMQLTDSYITELCTRHGEIIPARVRLKFEALGSGQYLLCIGHDLRKQTIQIEDESPSLFLDAIFLVENGQVADCFAGSEKSDRRMKADLETMLRDSAEMPERMARALQGERVAFGWESQSPDGAPCNVECTFARVEIDGQVRLLAIVVNVTASRKSEHALAQLSRRLLQLQDEERRRIGRELHDTTGQNLGALSINLSIILSTASHLDARTREALQESLALADASVREIRTMSYLLHPPLLDELGLISALRAYAEDYSERTGIDLRLDLSESMRRLPPAIEIALFRIAQEGLTNVHRHSGSKQVVLKLSLTRDLVELEVVDYGRGIPPAELERETAAPSGVGIAGMRERARQLGGRLTIRSSAVSTTLHVVIPAPDST